MPKYAYKIIGITGGIGAGKTFVSQKIRNLGYPVYEADNAAKQVMQQNEIIQQIQEAFGQESYQNGQLNRDHLSRVFKNYKALQKLNQIVHPAVAKHFENYLHHLTSDKTIVFKEAAILFESGTWKSCDKVVTVFAPLGIRIQRILHRDPHLSLEQILARIQQQWNDEWKIKHSNFTIFNDGYSNLDKQIHRMLQFIEQDESPSQ